MARIFPDEAMSEIRVGLCEATLDYDDQGWSRDVFEPWLAANQPILDALQKVGRPEMAKVHLDDGDQWALYGLSRLLDMLILPWQPPSTDPAHPADWLPA